MLKFTSTVNTYTLYTPNATIILARAESWIRHCQRACYICLYIYVTATCVDMVF